MSSKSNEPAKLDAKRFLSDPEYAAAHTKATVDEIRKQLEEPPINEGHREAQQQLMENMIDIHERQLAKRMGRSPKTNQQRYRVYVADPEFHVTTYELSSYPEAKDVLKQKSKELRKHHGMGTLTPACDGLYIQTHENLPANQSENSLIFVRSPLQSKSHNRCWESVRGFFEAAGQANN